MITAWRLVEWNRAGMAFDAEAAAQTPGRWNTAGTPIIDTADSPALAALELLVHLKPPDLRHEYALIPVRFSEALVVRIDGDSLPANWDATAAPPAVQRIGDEWVVRGATPVLAVPSAVVSLQTNYLINAGHRAFAEIDLGPAVRFHFDERLKS